MKAIIASFLLAFSLNSNAETTDIWSETENNLTIGSRLSFFNKTQERGDLLNENILMAYSNYQAVVLAWRVNNQIYQHKEDHHLSSSTQFELSELSYSFSLLISEDDLWQMGKFNYPVDPGYAFRSIGFFEKSVNPFDDFTSNEGINMLSSSIWLQDYYFSLLVALEGQIKGQNTAYENKKQWAILMQRDFDALSSSLILQQYQDSNLGMGASFTYVLADSWEFHGSSFIRKGSLWLTELDLKNSFSDREDKWQPAAALGSFWTSLHTQLLAEWSYQHEKLSNSEIENLWQIPFDNSNSHSILNLHQQRYQQHYFFLQYQYSRQDHTVTLNSLIGQDKSALSQLKYEYLSSSDINYWLSVELSSGDKHSEFKQIPWQTRLQIGLLWKI